mgnify:FL=1
MVDRGDFMQLLYEYRDTFVGPLELQKVCGREDLSDDPLYGAVFDAIDTKGTGTISEAQIRKFFLETPAIAKDIFGYEKQEESTEKKVETAQR